MVILDENRNILNSMDKKEQQLKIQQILVLINIIIKEIGF